jgi:hypothetical protein
VSTSTSPSASSMCDSLRRRSAPRWCEGETPRGPPAASPSTSAQRIAAGGPESARLEGARSIGPAAAKAGGAVSASCERARGKTA